MDASGLESNFICIYIVIHRLWLFQNPLVGNFILNKKYIEIISFLVVPPLLTQPEQEASQKWWWSAILSLTAKSVISLVVTCWEFRLEAVITDALSLLCLAIMLSYKIPHNLKSLPMYSVPGFSVWCRSESKQLEWTQKSKEKEKKKKKSESHKMKSFLYFRDWQLLDHFHLWNCSLYKVDSGCYCVLVFSLLGKAYKA